ncbi:hypothetical protein D0860_01639 [Hortaea werneckii]|uniref:Amine oxidase n=3 Tax=Hortaea werneckii TaxID=91943 RepID=A0A3M7HQM3_HORWE|nr:hypothetical protein D0860_01639 [Hortaea werneckii]
MYASSIDVRKPWSHPNASYWDSFTLATWMSQQNLTSPLQALLDTVIPTVLSAEPGELSFLYTLSYIAAAGNETHPGTFARLVGTTDGAQESRIVGGTGLLTYGLADQIGRHRTFLNTTVQKITKVSNVYYVRTSNRDYIATNIVVAMSPPLASRIHYEPPVSAQRDQLTQRMFMASIGKATAIYDAPFWRQANLTGQVLSDTGVVRSTFDVSPADGRYGAILGLMEADQMRALDQSTETEIKDLVVKDYVRYFGPQASKVSEWVIQRWDNELYSRGGPVAIAGPGTISKYGSSLRRCEGNIYWAGTESSDYWVGYMSGALKAGKLAANKILDSRL